MPAGVRSRGRPGRRERTPGSGASSPARTEAVTLLDRKGRADCDDELAARERLDVRQGASTDSSTSSTTSPATAFLLVSVHAGRVPRDVPRRGRAGGRVYTHGNTTLEIVWTIVPVADPGRAHVPQRAELVEDQDAASAEPDLVVQVTAKQFNWEVAYPGPDGKFGTADDKTLDNEMHVPVEQAGARRTSRRRTSSTASSCRTFRLKQDAVPGPRDRRSGSRRPSPASTRFRAPSCAASATPA